MEVGDLLNAGRPTTHLQDFCPRDIRVDYSSPSAVGALRAIKTNPPLSEGSAARPSGRPVWIAAHSQSLRRRPQAPPGALVGPEPARIRDRRATDYISAKIPYKTICEHDTKSVLSKTACPIACRHVNPSKDQHKASTQTPVCQSPIESRSETPPETLSEVLYRSCPITLRYRAAAHGSSGATPPN